MDKVLLIIGYVWPEPKSSAAGSRMMQLIEAFRSKNYNITFASPCAKSDNAFDLELIGVSEVPITLNSSSFDVFVRDLNPSVVLFDRFMMEEQFSWRIAEQCPKAMRVLDTEDLHCLRKGRHQALKASEPFNASYLFNDVAKREVASIYRSDLSLIISESEMEILKKDFRVESSLLCYLPFMMDEIPEGHIASLPKFEERQHFITIGNFLHKPNYDAVLYLKETIWPFVKKELPKAEMHVYGAYASQKVKQLHNKKQGFFVQGFVDDVNAVMQKARVCLAPLRFGAGLKGKLVDAMHNGTPCVTTKIGAEGMFGSMPPNGFIEDDPKAFAKKSIALYCDETLWETYQTNGFKVIKQRFNRTVLEKRFLGILDQTLECLDEKRLSNFTGQMLRHHTMQSTRFMGKWIEEKTRHKQ